MKKEIIRDPIKIKEAFQKVKSDIDFLKKDLNNLHLELIETRKIIIEITEIIKKIQEKQVLQTSTHKPKIPMVSTHPSTLQHTFKPLKHQILGISTGNQGVSTNKQTNTSTHQQTQKTPEIMQKTHKFQGQEIQKNSIDNAAEILSSLDNIKKDIRLKFKRLTDQEILIFSTIYQLDEEQGFCDHKTLSEKLNLSESSIRGYVGRLIKKGIPVEKKRINNKIIQVSISQNLKKIASLSTILQLRDL